MQTQTLNSQQLPLVIEPNGSKTKVSLTEWIKQNRAEFDKQFYHHGAILFRGFDIDTAKDFEDVALAVDTGLKNDYLGTSPRNIVKDTNYIFTASELPNYYPIMQHCEMSYVKQPPIKLFFYCHVEPQYGGETPVCNFRKVYEDMDPAIRNEFDKKGLLTVRNYSGLKNKSRFNLWELKTWDEIFLTKDKAEVEKQCRENEIEFEWQPNGNLRLMHRTPAAQQHPVTGQKVWFNHIQVFHVAAAGMEYKRIHAYQQRFSTFFWSVFTNLMVKVKKATQKPVDQSMNVLFGDGTEIPDSYVQHIEDLIWKHLVIFPWKKNDVLAIDNFSTSHGRLPYEGPREILVCWTA
jgi:alpha-ketoglutarate-dependent taurine dioxygenase